MKKLLNALKKSKSLFVIKLYAACWIVFFLVFAAINFLNYANIFWNELSDEIKVTEITILIVKLLIALIFSLGLYRSDKIGWISIAGFYYLFLFAILFNIVQNFSEGWQTLTRYLIAAILTSIPLIILNSKKIIPIFYSVRAENKIKNNVWATTLGIMILIALEILKQN